MESSTTRPQNEVTKPEELFAQLYPSLRRFAAAVASSDVDPDDLVQDALVAAFRAGAHERVEDLGAYLRVAIVNRERNHRRRSARRRAWLVARAGGDQAVTSYPSDLSSLDALKARDRALLYLTAVEDLPYAVIAELLGGSEASIRKEATRARTRLREVLSREERE